MEDWAVRSDRRGRSFLVAPDRMDVFAGSDSGMGCGLGDAWTDHVEDAA